MRKVIITVLFCAFALGAAKVRADEPFVAFGDNEKLTFVVSYSAKMIPNTNAAEVVIQTTKNETKGQYEIYAHGSVLNVFRWFFDIDDNYWSYLDAKTLLPQIARNKQMDGKRRFESEYVYDWDKMTVSTTYHKLHRWDEPRTKTMALYDNSFDPIALFYNLRCLDESELQEGAPAKLKLVLEDTIRTIDYKFLGREVKNIKGTGKYNTLKFSCQIASSMEEDFQDGTEFFLWISDDKNRIPLYIESPVRVGSIRARLIRYSGLRHENTALIK